MNLQHKVDYKDLDHLNHTILGKCDIAKVTDLVGALRDEITASLS